MFYAVRQNKEEFVIRLSEASTVAYVGPALSILPNLSWHETAAETVQISRVKAVNKTSRRHSQGSAPGAGTCACTYVDYPHTECAPHVTGCINYCSCRCRANKKKTYCTLLMHAHAAPGLVSPPCRGFGTTFSPFLLWREIVIQMHLQTIIAHLTNLN